MRAFKPFAVHDGQLIDHYAARLGEALAVRKAALEARAARAEAELSIRARSEFLSNMNHELRTPLNAIIGFATMLRDGDSYTLTSEQRSNYAEYVLQSADLLLAHIDTILEVAALDGGAVEMEPENLDLSRLLTEAVRRASIAADAAGVSIVDKGEGGQVAGLGDAQRLAQALDHLLRMSLRASPKGGRILVRASTGESGWPEIAIRDNGPGMSETEIARSLTVFDEVHRGLDRSFAGPGVGLAIAKTFIEMQGGRFQIKSRIGQGVLVRLGLPPAKAASAESNEQETEQEEVRLAG